METSAGGAAETEAAEGAGAAESDDVVMGEIVERQATSGKTKRSTGAWSMAQLAREPRVMRTLHYLQCCHEFLLTNN
jgi:hypothetical protein